jgi:hypothetical protein
MQMLGQKSAQSLKGESSFSLTHRSTPIRINCPRPVLRRKVGRPAPETLAGRRFALYIIQNQNSMAVFGNTDQSVDYARMTVAAGSAASTTIACWGYCGSVRRSTTVKYFNLNSFRISAISAGGGFVCFRMSIKGSNSK